VATESIDALVRALHAPGPAAEHAKELALYAFLVGRWQAEAILHPEVGATRTLPGEIHAGWVLGGRAIQDVWILPGIFHGTTLRVYDPGMDAWHIHWLDPVKQSYPSMIGRAHGADIVQEGTNQQGNAIRWRFTRITPGSFHWLGEVAPPGTRQWRLQLEFHARRIGGAAT
jgi:hypothetical protein